MDPIGAPCSRSSGDYSHLVALLAAVFPANVQMAMDVVRDEKAAGWFKVGAIARLPLQAPMIRIARKAAQG